MSANKSQLICRTCLKLINDKELYINAESKTEYGKIIDILETCVSELNLDITNDVVLCCDCTTMLRISYQFKLKCLYTEDKVFTFLQKHNLDIFDKISLNDVINYMNPANAHNTCQSDIKRKLLQSNKCLTNDEVAGDTKGVDYNRKVNGQNIEATNMIKTGSSSKADNYNNIIMFENSSKSDDCEIISVDYIPSSIAPNLSKCRKVDQYSDDRKQVNWKGADYLENLDRCKLSSCKEEYSDCLFPMSPVVVSDDDSLENFIFRPPL